jgi:hypothetical protein
MSGAKKNGCGAIVGQCPDIGFYCGVVFDSLPPPDCAFAVLRKRDPGHCKYLDRLPGGDFGVTCHCREAKLLALDGLYKEIMKMILGERYKLVAGLMRKKNRREHGKETD